jgi:hypothetical protein
VKRRNNSALLRHVSHLSSPPIFKVVYRVDFKKVVFKAVSTLPQKLLIIMICHHPHKGQNWV